MMRSVLAATLGIAALAAPASAQQAQPPQNQPEQNQPAAPPKQVDKGMIGLPVFSSDGQKLGEVTEVGELPGGYQAIRAEMGEFLGIGATAVVIASDMFQKKADRIELGLTAAEVRDSISRQRQNQKSNQKD
jgi:opacity protein-like surface antigen